MRAVAIADVNYCINANLSALCKDLADGMIDEKLYNYSFNLIYELGKEIKSSATNFCGGLIIANSYVESLILTYIRNVICMSTDRTFRLMDYRYIVDNLYSLNTKIYSCGHVLNA